MLADEARHWDSLARRVFIYTPDGAIDEWRSHAYEALNGQTIRDDCDGLASTVVHLCFKAGANLTDLYRLAVFASSDRSGHMVGCINTSDAGLLIIGDTFRSPYPAARMLHKPNIYRRLTSPDWQGGVPWILEDAK
jgi:hypothetical protein